jgi:flavin-dependent dehydrogenase
MQNIEKTDVCIVGAGPAGVATSMMLSNLKIHHYIIDKAIFPRDKTCGDGLILYAYKSMQLLGGNLFQNFLNNPKFIHSKNIQLHISDNFRVNFKECEDRNMVISYAKRIDFDDFLVNHLSEKYAHKNLGSAVKTIENRKNGVFLKLKNGKEILSKVVVGADGAQSIVARKLAKNKPNTKLMSTFVCAYFKDVKNLPLKKDAEVRLIYKDVLLFFYVFPLADGQVNISLGGRSNQIKKHNINLITEIEHIIKIHKKVKDKFTEATKMGAWRGWTIPFHFGTQKVVGARFFISRRCSWFIKCVLQRRYWYRNDVWNYCCKKHRKVFSSR